MTAKNAAIILGVTFIAVGILGYTSNPIIGPDEALFHTDSLHNIVHLVSGALFLLVAVAFPGSVRSFLKIFGVVYLFLGILGLFTIGSDGTTHLLGFLHVNGADNYLHIVLGLVIFLAGMLRETKTIRV